MQPQQEVALRRSTRERRPTISHEFVIYALKHKSDLRVDNDQVSYDQAIQSDNLVKWLVSMKDDMKSMANNNV